MSEGDRESIIKIILTRPDGDSSSTSKAELSVDDPRFEDTVFFITATDFEQQLLWEKYHERIEWVEDTRRISRLIGYIGQTKDFPVHVDFSWATFHGKRVCFVEASGHYSDDILIESYIEQKYPRTWDHGTRRAICNAWNFHHAVEATKEPSAAAAAASAAIHTYLRINNNSK